MSLVWLDNSADDDTTQQLKVLDNNLKIFKDKNECEEYVKSQSPDARITLIVNGTLGQELVPTIDSLPQIITIYVYCMNKEVHEKWAKTFPKVFV
jgi:hypothetical protein